MASNIPYGPGVFARCVSVTNVQNYVQKHMGSALKPFIADKIDDTLKANIKGAVMSKLYSLQSQGIIHNWAVHSMDVTDDGFVNIQMDIQPALGVGLRAMSKRNFDTHSWDEACPGEFISYRCKECSIEATVMDEELPLILTSDDMNCEEYAIKSIIE